MNDTILQKDKAFILFHRKVSELKKAKLITTKKKCYSYQYFVNELNEYENLYTELLPPEELIESFLLRFRHFILDKSAINIFKILNKAYNFASTQDDKDTIAMVRNAFSSSINGTFPEEIKKFTISKSTNELFRLFLNGQYFHLDKNLNQTFESLTEHNYKASKLGFLSALYAISRLLFLTDLIIRKIEIKI